MEPKKINNCSICLENIKSDIEFLPCIHAFHSECINELIKNNSLNPICPVCRIPIYVNTPEQLAYYNEQVVNQQRIRDEESKFFQQISSGNIHPVVSPQQEMNNTIQNLLANRQRVHITRRNLDNVIVQTLQNIPNVLMRATMQQVIDRYLSNMLDSSDRGADVEDNEEKNLSEHDSDDSDDLDNDIPTLSASVSISDSGMDALENLMTADSLPIILNNLEDEDYGLDDSKQAEPLSSTEVNNEPTNITSYPNSPATPILGPIDSNTENISNNNSENNINDIKMEDAESQN